MRKIKLTRGKYTLVDDEDYDYLNQFNWHYCKSRQTGYAIRSAKHPSKKGKYVSIRMHTDIMKQKPIDHINGNGLDNRKSNLRNCTNAENQRNRRTQKNKKYSRFKGVTKSIKHKNTKKPWYAVITFNDKRIFLGTFKKEIEAARAYNSAAKKYHEEFARLNRIKDVKNTNQEPTLPIKVWPWNDFPDNPSTFNICRKEYLSLYQENIRLKNENTKISALLNLEGK